MNRVNIVSLAGAVISCVVIYGSFVPAALQTRTVRLAMVNVPDDVVRPLMPEFNKQFGQQVEIVYTGNDPFAVARDGKADLVIAHYGHEGVAPFVTGGFGLWPHAVFANQGALIGPPSDPAHVRGLADAAEAMRRIAATHSRFVVNNSAGNRYVEDILWTRAGNPARGDWYLDRHSQGPQAARDAAKEGAYTLWGVQPFLRLKRQSPLNLEPLVTADSIFRRIMVAIVVNPQKVSGVNDGGAEAFQNYLLTPSRQARISAFRYQTSNSSVVAGWAPQQRPGIGYPRIFAASMPTIAMMRITASAPTHAPALKIPPTTSQPGSAIVTSTNSSN